MKSVLLKIKKIPGRIIFVLVWFYVRPVFSQDFPPQAGISGTTAIYKDSPFFVDWASECKIKRGFVFYDDTSYFQNGSNKANFGNDTLALGKAKGTMDVVSLGDGGYAVLAFHYPIIDGEGYDFAVFENGFADPNSPELAFLELAFVEVSPDGENFYRFPAVCQISDTKQITTFDKINARYIHNLAGKYIANYGTPFDLSELKQVYPSVDFDIIYYVKIIDVIGAINKPFTNYDYYGNPINDPYPTPFASGGFDLDAVGVIHNILELNNGISIFPNPTKNFINIYNPEGENLELKIMTPEGKIILSKKFFNKFETISLNINYNGFLFIFINNGQKAICKKILFLN